MNLQGFSLSPEVQNIGHCQRRQKLCLVIQDGSVWDGQSSVTQEVYYVYSNKIK